MCRVSMGHLRVTVGSLHSLQATVGHLRITVGHLGLTRGNYIFLQNPSKSSKCNNTEMLWKIQEIFSKMGTKIFEIDEKMSEIIDAKVGNPQNSTSLKSANLSQP